MNIDFKFPRIDNLDAVIADGVKQGLLTVDGDMIGLSDAGEAMIQELSGPIQTEGKA